MLSCGVRPSPCCLCNHPRPGRAILNTKKRNLCEHLPTSMKRCEPPAPSVPTHPGTQAGWPSQTALHSKSLNAAAFLSQQMRATSPSRKPFQASSVLPAALDRYSPLLPYSRPGRRRRPGRPGAGRSPAGRGSPPGSPAC